VIATVTEANRRWWTLAGASAGLVVLVLDSTVVAVALPPIRRELGTSVAGVQWAQNVYLVALAALLVAIRRLGDSPAGRRSRRPPARPAS
jgi:MFS family permease